MQETMSPTRPRVSDRRQAEKTVGTPPREAGGGRLCPALLSGFRDLTSLRHDYPLVLAEGTPKACIQSLSEVTNGILREIAPRGVQGERLRMDVLRLESQIRLLVDRGEQGSLARLWDRAQEDLLSRTADAPEEQEALTHSLCLARKALRCRGEVIGCDAETPGKFFHHAWQTVQQERNRQILEEIDGLVLQLSNILKADVLSSDAGRTASALKAGMSPGYQGDFDFEAMSGLLRKALPERRLPENRRERILRSLSVLESQKFFSRTGSGPEAAGPAQTHGFVFESCCRALQAFQERLPEMVEFIQAVRIAELEIANRYREKQHDPLFARFDERSLTAEDLMLFPFYLVCLQEDQCDEAEKAAILEGLSSPVPLKILLQVDDILRATSGLAGQRSWTGWAFPLAPMAVGLHHPYVAQVASATFYARADSILRGMEHKGPSLFSVFSGAQNRSTNLTPYHVSAAAVQSRAFPVFTYDPAAGDNWAARFDLAGNPQPEALWPATLFSYEDARIQRQTETVCFTFVDFVAGDPRYTSCFRPVPSSEWPEAMVPIAEYLQLEKQEAREKVPYILMVDENDLLHRVIVSDFLMERARGSAERWRYLQEWGGIQNSHALRLLEKERALWQEQKQREMAEISPSSVPQAGQVSGAEAPAPTKPDAREALETPGEEPSADEPYIETVRCTSCNECTNKNKKMFAYNENKQAYIKDPEAGTFRDLVEAAEKCPVCIIHPGKPRNANEPNLEEWIRRAEAFNSKSPNRQGSGAGKTG